MVHVFVDMCGVEGKRRLCDLNVTSLSPAFATRHIRCVLLVNSPNKLNLLSWLLIFLFFREDDLLTCKKSTKNKTKQQHKSTWQQIDNISLALMKQFNLFPVARGMLTITHDQNIIYTSKYIYK